MDSPVLLVIMAVAVGIPILLLFIALFEPPLPHKISKLPSALSDSKYFLRLLSALVDAPLYLRSHIEVLTNGEVYYETELEAVRAARFSINMEAYIFQKGDIARRFVEALTERAQAGVQVRVLLDAVGSFSTNTAYFKELRAAGGRVEWYHPLRWYTLPRLNNRTHRELIVIDGRVGFLGGAGVADHWLKGKGKRARWRDTMFRVEGDIVASLQSTFAENWLEASGEILTAREDFSFCAVEDRTTAMVVGSSVSANRSTRARILYQMLLASAQECIYITTPYFLADKSVRDELVRAIKARGVRIKILTTGQHTDHLLTRHSSRRIYGDLLKVGAEIYEYMPSMLHTKTMIIDRVWSVVGSTNFDNRSFGLNSEVNLVAFDRPLAARLYEDFMHDLAQSRPISYAEWRRRSIFERFHEWLGWVLERQE